MNNVIKTTPWFSGEEKPLEARIGIYERDLKDGIGGYYYWWDGHFFGPGTTNIENAEKLYHLMGRGFYQDLPWRGVMK